MSPSAPEARVSLTFLSWFKNKFPKSFRSFPLTFLSSYNFPFHYHCRRMDGGRSRLSFFLHNNLKRIRGEEFFLCQENFLLPVEGISIGIIISSTLCSRLSIVSRNWWKLSQLFNHRNHAEINANEKFMQITVNWMYFHKLDSTWNLFANQKARNVPASTMKWVDANKANSWLSFEKPSHTNYLIPQKNMQMRFLLAAVAFHSGTIFRCETLHVEREQKIVIFHGVQSAVVRCSMMKIYSFHSDCLFF